MEPWQSEIVKEKLELNARQMFGLEVDLRVARRIGDAEAEKHVVELMKRAESIKLALEEESHV
jgi:hypothetical protein